jgi:hypothetical protein
MQPLKGFREISALTGKPIPTTEEKFDQYSDFYDRAGKFLHRGGMEAAELAPGSGEYLSAARARQKAAEAEEAIMQGNFKKGFFKYLDMASELPGVIPGVSQAMFLGMKAKNASKSLLKQAMSMGGDKKKIFEETGWFKGNDGLWRFEIPDDSVKLDPFFLENPDGVIDVADWRVFDLINHPQLFKAYPELRDTMIDLTIKPGLSRHGTFLTPDDWTSHKPFQSKILVEAPNHEDATNTLLHELQHNIQFIEGFARGGSWREFPKGRIPLPILAAHDEVLDEIQAVLGPEMRRLIDAGVNPHRAADAVMKSMNKSHSSLLRRQQMLAKEIKRNEISPAHAQYRNIAGEIESIDTTDRRFLSEYARRKIFPDVRDDAIIKWWDEIPFTHPDWTR